MYVPFLAWMIYSSHALKSPLMTCRDKKVIKKLRLCEGSRSKLLRRWRSHISRQRYKFIARQTIKIHL